MLRLLRAAALGPDGIGLSLVFTAVYTGVFREHLQLPMAWLLPVPRIAGTVVLAPMVEALAFRGYLTWRLSVRDACCCRSSTPGSGRT